MEGKANASQSTQGPGPSHFACARERPAPDDVAQCAGDNPARNPVVGSNPLRCTAAVERAWWFCICDCVGARSVTWLLHLVFLRLATSPVHPPCVAFFDTSSRIPSCPRGRSRSCHLRWCNGSCGRCFCLCGCLRTASWRLAPIGFPVPSRPIALLGPTLLASPPSVCRHESPSPGGCCRSRRI